MFCVIHFISNEIYWESFGGETETQGIDRRAQDRFVSIQGLAVRDVQKEIHRYWPQREIIILTGSRRRGKSSLMTLIAQDLIQAGGVSVHNVFCLNLYENACQ